MNKIDQQGFTLLELLIAAAVFAVLSVMAYGGLRVMLDTKAATTEKSAQLEALQMTLYLMNEDLAQAAPRPIRDAYGLQEPAFGSGTDGNLLTLTRSAPRWSTLQKGSQLQRVSYRVEKGVLYRQVWSALDRTQQTDYTQRALMPVRHAHLRFYSSNWSDNWLVDGQSTALPKAVEANFDLAGQGTIQRLFYLHD